MKSSQILRETRNLSCLPQPTTHSHAEHSGSQANARCTNLNMTSHPVTAQSTLYSLVPNTEEQVPASCYQDQRERKASTYLAIGHCNISAVLGPDSPEGKCVFTTCHVLTKRRDGGREACICEGFVKLTNQKTAGQSLGSPMHILYCIHKAQNSTTVRRWGDKVTENVRMLPAARGISQTQPCPWRVFNTHPIMAATPRDHVWFGDIQPGQPGRGEGGREHGGL